LSTNGERLSQNTTFEGEGFKEATLMATKKKAAPKKKAAKKKKH
jgi:hypothetical protein